MVAKSPMFYDLSNTCYLYNLILLLTQVVCVNVIDALAELCNSCT